MASMKTRYHIQLASLRELFSALWNDDDLVAVLQEVNGDLETAIARISEGWTYNYSFTPYFVVIFVFVLNLIFLSFFINRH